jgi:hypothetical protein
MSQATNLTTGFQSVMVLILKNICTFDMEIKPTNECKHLKASYYELSYMYVFEPHLGPSSRWWLQRIYYKMQM